MNGLSSGEVLSIFSMHFLESSLDVYLDLLKLGDGQLSELTVSLQGSLYSAFAFSYSVLLAVGYKWPFLGFFFKSYQTKFF